MRLTPPTQQDADAADLQPTAIMALLGSICLLVVVAASGALAPLPPLHVVVGPGPLALRAVVELPRLALAGPPSVAPVSDASPSRRPRTTSSAEGLAVADGSPSVAAAEPAAPVLSLVTNPVPTAVTPVGPLPSQDPTSVGEVPVGSETPTVSQPATPVVEPSTDPTETPGSSGVKKPTSKPKPPAVSRPSGSKGRIHKPARAGSSKKYRSGRRVGSKHSSGRVSKPSGKSRHSSTKASAGKAAKASGKKSGGGKGSRR